MLKFYYDWLSGKIRLPRVNEVYNFYIFERENSTLSLRYKELSLFVYQGRANKQNYFQNKFFTKNLGLMEKSECTYLLT